jgi:ATP/maltotriose-dependent transcriptional regulator MalT
MLVSEMTDERFRPSDPLLKSKLLFPPSRPNPVLRPRLTERLRQALHHALTLISAPAGYGKTTLIGEWSSLNAGDDVRQSYVALDVDDHDPIRFASYLVNALATQSPEAAQEALALLESALLPSLKVVLTALLNQITVLDTPLILVLDDYHCVTSAAIHDAMSFVLEHLPPQLHLVIATRVDPPLPLARLRARGQLVEIRAADLAFNAQEAAGFLSRTAGLRLKPGDSAALHARTEGWPAGLQLAALALQNDVNFAGSHRYVFDYLAVQVLEQQSETVQAFLLQTCLLDRLTGALCDAVTGRADGALILAQLEQANLFILPLDDERRWYRYHSLLADCLRERLRQQATATGIKRLHKRASRWYEDNGLLAKAIQHAVAAPDLARASLLIERAAEPAMSRGEVETILNWIKTLPEQEVRARPGLCVWYAWALCLTGMPGAVEPWLQRAEAALHSRLDRDDASVPRCRSKLGEIAAIRAFAGRLRGDLAQSMAQSQLARKSLDGADLIVHSAVAQNLGATYIAAGNYEAGRRALVEAERASRAAGHAYIYIGTLVSRARLDVLERRLPEAVASYEQARAHCAKEGLARLSREIGDELGRVLREWNGLVEPLSPRELQILKLVALGASTREIAVELVITVGTVRNHLKNIYGKLGAHSRLQVVEKARALKLVQPI